MKKCKECGIMHRNHSEESGYKEIGDLCFNCMILLKAFWAAVEGLNRSVPLNGKPRRITITGYKIEKI